MEKIITEKSDMRVGDYVSSNKEQSFLIPFPEIQKHLDDGWKIKQMFVHPYGINGSNQATDLIITVHLERL